LLVHPGTVVKLMQGSGVKIDIYGVMRAVGTVEDTIVFTSDLPVPDTADWNDIRFMESSVDSECELRYCKLEYARWGIGCRGASPTITHCRVANSRFVGILCVGDASPLIAHNTVEGADEYGIWSGGSSSPTIEANVLQDNDLRGISCVDSATPTIEGNTISGSSWGGISIGGISSPVIRGNTITQNRWGIVVWDSASPFIGGSLSGANDIFGNIDHALVNFRHDTVTAEYNYWGTVDGDSISALIDNDPGSYTDYTPWVNATHDTIYPSNELPVADAGGPYMGQEGSAVLLSASGSTDDWGIVSWEWDLDADGTYDTSGVSIEWTWMDDRTGSVIVRVTDVGGLTDTDEAEVVVENVPPVGDAYGPYAGNVNEAVQLSGGVTDPGADSHAYAWDLDGDGDFDDAMEQSPTHAWSVSGDHLILLEVSDDDGGTHVDSAVVTIINYPPTAAANGPWQGDEGSSILLDGSGSVDDGTIALWLWDLDGDGVYDSSGMTLAVSWSDDHSGIVILEVTDNEGLTDVDTNTVEITNVSPIPDAGGPYLYAVNEEVVLSGSADEPGADTIAYEWDLDGDGEFDDASGETVSYTWSTVGLYEIYLRVTDDDGGMGIDTTVVTIGEPRFIRADANGDSLVTMGDAIYAIRYLFVPGSQPPPSLKAADADDNGEILMSDAIHTLRHLYVPGSPQPPLPFPNCGADPTPDSLQYGSHPCMREGHLLGGQERESIHGERE
jgi:parallel beta-helix repeat protein